MRIFGFTNPKSSRLEDFAADTGIIAQPTLTLVTGAAAATQVIYGTGVHLYAGESITNIIVNVTTAGAGTTPTNLRLGLWNSAATPVCVANTPDIAATGSLTSNGYKVTAISAGPYVVPASGLYYAAVWQNGAFGSTPVAFSVINQSGPQANTIVTKAPFVQLKTGATTMAVGDTGTYGTGGVTCFWAALS